MAASRKHVVHALGEVRPINSVRPPGEAAAQDLPLLRFGTRHLLVFVAALSVLLAGLVSLDGIPVLAMLLAVVVVAFHVFSTALGSQLRRHAASQQARHLSSPNERRANSIPLDSPTPHAANTRVIRSPWYGRTGASWAWLPKLVAVAAVFGSCLGLFVLPAVVDERISFSGFLVSAVSLAALSSWFAFLAGSFVVIVRGGLSDAVVEEDKGESGRPIQR